MWSYHLGFARGWVNCRGGRQPRYEPGDAMTILFVLTAKVIDEIAFLDDGCQRHVSGEDSCKQQVSHGHGGRGPKCDRQTEVKRMSNLFVEKRYTERQRLVFASFQVQPDLACAK